MNELAVFAKYWKPGAVKTRLAADVGAGPAAEVYRTSLLTTLSRLFGLGGRHVLAYWPPGRRPMFQSIAGNHWTLIAQTPGDLGTRMKQFFIDAFSRGAKRVVLVGSDSPTLPREYVKQAWLSLDDSPVVLGPTDDGGYYLVGVSEIVPPIFENVQWSSSSVWDQTIENLSRSGLPYAELPAWYDVDDVHDLRRLRQELRCIEDDRGDWGELRRATERALTET